MCRSRLLPFPILACTRPPPRWCTLVAMQIHRTTSCGGFGHREITLQLTGSPVPGLHRGLIDYFERAVARGAKFLPGQTVQVGWSTLRICERADGTLGVQERELQPTLAWTESVDRALYDLWVQREIVASVGLQDKLTFPAQDDLVMVSGCGMEGHGAMVFIRLPAQGLPERFSGWTLACAQNHDHGERHILPLMAIAATRPGLVQLLALPHDTTVLVRYAEKPDAPGALRIEPHVLRDGREIAPSPGSYLAALQA